METEHKFIKLRLELDLSRLTEIEMDSLRKYGKVEKGIIREVAVPKDMPIHALHYAI